LTIEQIIARYEKLRAEASTWGTTNGATGFSAMNQYLIEHKAIIELAEENGLTEDLVEHVKNRVANGYPVDKIMDNIK
tara:strand:- start:282 stop:515 length:234 start_codon:yes stop_codon:yes gene_type:complete